MGDGAEQDTPWTLDSPFYLRLRVLFWLGSSPSLRFHFQRMSQSSEMDPSFQGVPGLLWNDGRKAHIPAATTKDRGVGVREDGGVQKSRNFLSQSWKGRLTPGPFLSLCRFVWTHVYCVSIVMCLYECSYMSIVRAHMHMFMCVHVAHVHTCACVHVSVKPPPPPRWYMSIVCAHVCMCACV